MRAPGGLDDVLAGLLVLGLAVGTAVVVVLALTVVWRSA